MYILGWSDVAKVYLDVCSQLRQCYSKCSMRTSAGTRGNLVRSDFFSNH